MTTLPAHFVSLGIGLTITAAATVLERAGYDYAFETTLAAALVAAAGLLTLVRAAPAWFQVD